LGAPFPRVGDGEWLWLAASNQRVQEAASGPRLGSLRLRRTSTQPWTQGCLLAIEGILHPGLPGFPRHFLPPAASDLFGSMNTEMELLPGTLATSAVLGCRPFSGASAAQPSAANEEMDRSLDRNEIQAEIEPLTSPRESDVVGSCQDRHSSMPALTAGSPPPAEVTT
jgi:hypothetical protein